MKSLSKRYDKEILGDNFFLCDLLDQDELFQCQGQLANVICTYANNGNKMAKHFSNQLPNTFYTK